MEYTKDLILNINYGHANTNEGEKNGILEKVVKHKMFISIIFVTITLMVLDIALVSSFIEILSKI